MHRTATFLIITVLVACGDDASSTDGGRSDGSRSDGGRVDSGMIDGGGGSDASATDGGPTDAGPEPSPSCRTPPAPTTPPAVATPAFGATGVAEVPSGGVFGRAISVRPTGEIVVAGDLGDMRVGQIEIDGTVDAVFGTSGVATIDLLATDMDADVVGLVRQLDGRYVVASQVACSGCSNLDFALTRLQPDGAFDATFGTAGWVHEGVMATNEQPSGIVIGPYDELTFFGHADTGIVAYRYRRDGQRDEGFGTDGVITDDRAWEAYAGTLAPDGALLLAGRPADTIDPVLPVFRYTCSGARDATFGTDGMVTFMTGRANSTALDVFVLDDGKILVVARVGSGPELALIRLESDGTPDATFGTDGIVFHDLTTDDDDPRAAAIDAMGRIVVAGGLVLAGDFVLARFTSDGALDATFGTAGIVRTIFGAGSSRGEDLAIQSDGKIVVAQIGGSSGMRVARYTSGGVLDRP